MEHSASHSELFHACRVLFGQELQCSREFLDYLQIGGVKSAFRRRAMETHPDRLPLGGRNDAGGDASGFHLVCQAYENLLGFLRDKEQTPPTPHGDNRRGAHDSPGFSGPWPRIRPIVLPEEVRGRRGFANTECYHQGELPERVLLFGHFLYYAGLANWRTIARVLAWQRGERPRLGEIGLRYGWLDRQDIALVLQRRRPFAPFGETARALGLLDQRQIRLLLARQQQLQKKFGTILVEKNLLKDYELQELLQRFQEHNESVGNHRRN